MNEQDTFTEKKERIKKIFSQCKNNEEIYIKIIEMGADLPPMPEHDLLDQFLVEGCQSKLYFKPDYTDDLFTFKAHSDALISKGLAALLFNLYNNEPPLILLKNPPSFLSELGIIASLSPTRSNGFASLFLKMQQSALYFLAKKSPV